MPRSLSTLLRGIGAAVLDRYRWTRLSRLDWITRNRLVMERGRKALEASARERGRLPGRLKILMWAPMPWERGGVEHLLARSLQAHGHEVHGLRCTGGMPACSMESVLFPRPECRACLARHDRLLEAMGLRDAYRPIDAYLDARDRAEIDALVDPADTEALRDLVLDGIPVGRKALADLPQFFFRLVSLDSDEVRAYYRRAVKAYALHARAAGKALDAVRPDRALTTSGRTVSISGFYEACRARGVPVATWDEAVGGLGAFIFCFDDIAVNYRKPAAWARLAREPLTPEEDGFVGYYFARTRKGQFGRHTYYNAPVEDRAEIVARLGLDPARRLTVLLTNLTWDTSALDKDVAFAGMLDWITRTIERYAGDPAHQVVVRTHPAEGHAAAYARGCESVAQVIQRRFPSLPPHIRVVSGTEEISSHALAELADRVAVYTTSVAMELAVQGRAVLVVGDSHYRGKGFTVDVRTPEEYFALLEGDGPLTALSPAQVALARKYVHYFIVRTEVYLPEFNLRDRHRFVVRDARDLLPGASSPWPALCRNVEERGDFLDCAPYIDPWQEGPAGRA